MIFMKNEFKFTLNPNVIGADDTVFTALQLKDNSYLISWKGEDFDKEDPPIYKGDSVLQYVKEGSWIVLED
jgi:hypothetical protein